MGTLWLNKSSRVVEPELDMNRRSQRMTAGLSWLWDFLRMLAPGSRTIGPPMRSVDRELQELWPSRER